MKKLLNRIGFITCCVLMTAVANAATKELFRFPLPESAQGPAGCSPLVTTESGTGANVDCTRIKSQPQIPDTNGTCTTTGAGEPTYSDWICKGDSGETPCAPVLKKTAKSNGCFTLREQAQRRNTSGTCEDYGAAKDIEEVCDGPRGDDGSASCPPAVSNLDANGCYTITEQTVQNGQCSTTGHTPKTICPECPEIVENVKSDSSGAESENGTCFTAHIYRGARNSLNQCTKGEEKASSKKTVCSGDSGQDGCPAYVSAKDANGCYYTQAQTKVNGTCTPTGDKTTVCPECPDEVVAEKVNATGTKVADTEVCSRISTFAAVRQSDGSCLRSNAAKSVSAITCPGENGETKCSDQYDTNPVDSNHNAWTGETGKAPCVKMTRYTATYNASTQKCERASSPIANSDTYICNGKDITDVDSATLASKLDGYFAKPEDVVAATLCEGTVKTQVSGSKVSVICETND